MEHGKAQNNENPYELFCNTALVGSVRLLYEPDMPILWANNYFFEMLGYTREEYTKRFQDKLSRSILDEDLFMLSAGASRWFDKKNRSIMNVRYLHKSGKIIWVKVSAVLTDEYHGDIPVVDCVITDITVLKEYELTLSRQAAFLKSTMDSSLVGVFQFVNSKAPKITYSNDTAYKILGFTQEEYFKKHSNYMYKTLPQEEINKLVKIHSELELNGPSIVYELRNMKNGGSEQWLLAASKRCINQNGIDVIQCEFFDITSMKKAQQDIQEQNAQIDNLIDSIPGGVCIVEYTTVEMKVIYCNEAYYALLHLNKKDYMKKGERWNIGTYCAQADYKRLKRAADKCLENGKTVNLDIPIIRADGEQAWVNIHAVIYKRTEESALFHAVVTDITDFKTKEEEFTSEQRRDKEEIARLANCDSLTGLWNRSIFRLKAKEVLAEADPSKIYALVYSDINNFSYINEHFGYEAGNRALKDFSDTIFNSASSLHGCRLFSDYFVSFSCVDSKEELVRDIKERNEEFNRIQREKYPASDIRISTGVYIFEESDNDVTLAMDNANLARRKIKGSRSVICGFYTDELRAERAREQRITSEIHTAIQNGEIELFLQPKFSLDKREMIGAEALVRWRKADGTLRMPGEFIGILEAVGYVVEVDFYILEQVLKCQKRWRREGRKPIAISVNLSRLHNNYPNFVERLCEMVDSYRVPHELIEVEITESAFAADNKVLFENLRILRERGFRTDIDDFGVGYSSLSVLMVAPIDVVKIDKAFIDNLTRSEKDEQYLYQMCKLIDMTGKEILFEGVETEEQAALLRSFGFTKAQGYLFDRAITVKEFEEKYME